MRKPHMEIGQKGRGKGRVKKKRRRGQAPPPGLPTTTPPALPPFPEMPPEAPGFLPMTPGYEATQRGLSDQLAAAQAAFNSGNEMIAANTNLATARAGTDRDYATQRVNNETNDRGIYNGGVRGQLLQRDVELPFGRQLQDIGTSAASQYADLAAQYGNANLGYSQGQTEGLLQRADDAYNQQPLSLPLGGYDVPPLPAFNPIYPNGQGGGGGKVRRKRKRKKGRR